MAAQIKDRLFIVCHLAPQQLKAKPLTKGGGGRCKFYHRSNRDASRAPELKANDRGIKGTHAGREKGSFLDDQHATGAHDVHVMGCQYERL